MFWCSSSTGECIRLKLRNGRCLFDYSSSSWLKRESLTWTLITERDAWTGVPLQWVWCELRQQHCSSKPAEWTLLETKAPSFHFLRFTDVFLSLLRHNFFSLTFLKSQVFFGNMQLTELQRFWKKMYFWFFTAGSLSFIVRLISLFIWFIFRFEVLVKIQTSSWRKKTTASVNLVYAVLNIVFQGEAT